MNRDVLAAAGIEWDKGVARCMDNVALYEKSLRGFMEEPKLNEALELFRIHDYERLQDCAQEIRVVCRNLGLTRVCETAAETAETLRKRELNRLPGAMDRMEEAYRSALAALTQVLDQAR